MDPLDSLNVNFWSLVEGEILHWETLLRVVEATAFGFLRNTQNFSGRTVGSFRDFGSSRRHTHQTIKTENSRQMLYLIRTGPFFHSCPSSYRTCKKIMCMGHRLNLFSWIQLLLLLAESMQSQHRPQAIS